MTDEQQIDLIYCTRKELQQRYEASVYTNTPLVIEHLALWPYHSAEGLKTWDGDYSQIELDGLVAHDAVLEGVRLVQSRLVGVDLTGAVACSSNLWKANLTKAILNKVNFAGATLVDASFTEAQMQGVCLVGADASGAHFDEADLEGANLAGCYFIGATFCGANLRGADFTGCTMVLCDLARADCTGATFEGAGLFPARIYDTTYKPGQFDNAGRLFLFDAKAMAERMRYQEDDEERYL
jgi:uncharacterized protein YjbI with pentapeptide repeats